MVQSRFFKEKTEEELVLNKKPQPAAQESKKKASKSRKQCKFLPTQAKNTWLTPASQLEETVADHEDCSERFKPPPLPEAEVNNEFIQFVKSRQPLASTDWEISICDYLVRGAPYKGCHRKLFKRQIKMTGCRWMTNPHVVEGVFDSHNPYGWYSAFNLMDLLCVVSLPCTEAGEKAWWPHIVGSDLANPACVFVQDLIHEYHLKKKQALERERLEAIQQRVRREKGASGGGGMHVLDDTQQDIERLVSVLSVEGEGAWEYDPRFIQSSGSIPELGPSMKTHAKRVLRALTLGIVTADQVRRGEFVSERKAKATTSNGAIQDDNTAAAATAAAAAVAQTERKRKRMQESEDSNKFLKSDAQLEEEAETQGMADAEQLALDLKSELCQRAQATWKVLVPSETVCTECSHCVSTQFGCKCVARDWVACRKCWAYKCNGQACEC